jgi:hypothetical protein
VETQKYENLIFLTTFKFPGVESSFLYYGKGMVVPFPPRSEASPIE